MEKCVTLQENNGSGMPQFSSITTDATPWKIEIKPPIENVAPVKTFQRERVSKNFVGGVNRRK